MGLSPGRRIIKSMAISHPNPNRRLLDGVTETPFPGRNRTTGTTISETNFDSNMVIILAALLCALICALGLNSIVRCAIRCSHRFASGSPEEAAVRLATAGMKKSVVCQIPVGVYGKEMDIPATECPICLGEFVDGEKLRILPKCSHGFHVKCIDMWLVSRSSCPLCRQLLPESLMGAGGDVAVSIPANSAGEERL